MSEFTIQRERQLQTINKRKQISILSSIGVENEDEPSMEVEHRRMAGGNNLETGES